MRFSKYSQRPRRSSRTGRRVLIACLATLSAGVVSVPVLHQATPPRAHSLTVPAGLRAAQVYTTVDKALALSGGTTARASRSADLPLPTDAAGNAEGYLFPSTYRIDSGTTPESLLTAMVDASNHRLRGVAARHAEREPAMNLYQVVTVASLVQAESVNRQDMPKLARVVYNRLSRGLPLELGSTVNYATGREGRRVAVADTKVAGPYNTFMRMGLPPAPIGNPGTPALQAALHPAPGRWIGRTEGAAGAVSFTADTGERRIDHGRFEYRR